jgi:hypothetical protein
MFFTSCAPRKSKPSDSLFLTCSNTEPETSTPPGSASCCSLAAMLTPSPKRSPPSTITSPRLMPIRSSMRRPSGSAAFRSASSRWMRTAQSTAFTTLANSASTLSPDVLTSRPRCPAIFSMIASR